MWIKNFKVSQLHGVLDLEIQFNEDLTIIVGRNGAGKTSALNLISDILRVNIKGILEKDFIRAELQIVDETDGELSIIVDRSAETPCFEIFAGPSKVGAIPLSLVVDSAWWSAKFDGLAIGEFEKRARNIYFGGTSISGEATAAKKFLTDRVDLTFVRLDRTVVATDSAGLSHADVDGLNPDPKSKKLSERRIVEPIEIVKGVTKARYLSYKSAQEKIKERVVEQLLRLQFNESESVDSPVKKRSTEKRLIQQIEELERQVSRSTLIQETPGLVGPVNKFFRETRRLLELSFKPRKAQTGRRTKAEEELESILIARQWRVQKLLEIFEVEQTQTSAAFERIELYLSSAQEFFDDSEKQLCFSEKTFELGFQPRFTDITVLRESEVRDLTELSSGEKQVLIILTYLAFLANDRSIFMVDEPELSLHLRWQSNLVKSIRTLTPSGCQIILATHAPEIAGLSREKCFILSPTSVHR
jgi:predicted ATPase